MCVLALCVCPVCVCVCVCVCAYVGVCTTAMKTPVHKLETGLDLHITKRFPTMDMWPVCGLVQLDYGPENAAHHIPE